MKALRLVAVSLMFVAVIGMRAAATDAGPQTGSTGPERTDHASATKLDIASLPNTMRLNERVFSGGRPDGEQGFDALRHLGVRTVISVDGAKPNVEAAKKFGLAYVHLPHGYDGISARRSVELAKAVSDLAGPIYIHCHHGKHRSPAAAAVACIGAGMMTRTEGKRVLKLAGTSPDYHGLYQTVARAGRVPRLDSAQVEFRETVEVPPLAASMVQIERTFDNLEQIEQAGWQAPASHPDLSPAHEALLLREHFTELLRTKEVLARPTEFRKLLEHSRSQTVVLETALRATAGKRNARPGNRPSAVLTAIGHDCHRCHRNHRD